MIAMNPLFRIRNLAAILLWLQPAIAFAGMPMADLSDIARMRIQTISFFLLGFLLSARLVQLIWNSLRSDFPRLPHLAYRTAVGVVGLWGLLFLLVLTMISGARELLTPGAWAKQGLTYRLADVPPAPAAKPGPPPESIDVRRARLERLRVALWSYAKEHGGAFPASADDLTPADLWEVPDPSGMRYLYVAGRRPGEVDAVLAYEPGLFGSSRLTLSADGEVRFMSVDA